MSENRIPIRRALVSVYDKTGLEELVRGLHDAGVTLVSTGGSARLIEGLGLPVTKVEDLTGFPECLDGRVKTLHPRVHAGILADRRLDSHVQQLADLEVEPFDLVVSNLYPFTQTVASGASPDECVEQIDIGGPSMVRAAAKNHPSVAIVTSPERYADVLAATSAGGFTLEQRKQLAAEAFVHTASYDVAVASWMGNVLTDSSEAESDQGASFPAWAGATWERSAVLRYGENPHQAAALYRTGHGPAGLAGAEQLHGKEMSYNNYVDTDAARRAAYDFDEPAVAIIKHANPCGVAQRKNLLDAWTDALHCDSVSAFGGIVATNVPLDGPTAEAICQIFTEVVVAPGADDAARAAFAKKKNLRLLITDGLPDPRRPGVTQVVIAGGLLVQTRDNGAISEEDLKIVTKRQPSEQELKDCLFAWTVARHVKSNAIVYAKNGATAGIGAGQMNRRDSSRIAAMKAKEAAETYDWAEPRTKGSAVASDAFFPFADGLLAAAEAGATAIIQPGGSIRDEEVIAAADEHDLAMVFTGMRHFRH